MSRSCDDLSPQDKIVSHGIRFMCGQFCTAIAFLLRRQYWPGASSRAIVNATCSAKLRRIVSCSLFLNDTTPAPTPETTTAPVALASQDGRGPTSPVTGPGRLQALPPGPWTRAAQALQRTGNAEPNIVVPVGGRVPVAVGRAHVARVVVVGAAADHAPSREPVRLPQRGERTPRCERGSGAGARCWHGRRARPKPVNEV